eukprot:jgi/Picre1/29755/NNA_005137.t1
MGEKNGMPHGIRKRVIKDNGIKPATHEHTYEKEQEKKNASVPGGRATATTAADHTSSFRVLLLLPLMGLLVLFGVVGTLRMRQHSVQPTSRHSSMKVFTTEELGMYDGKQRRGGPLYLAILGSVFDVTQGKRHYGPGGSYHFFAGRDASRAYTTGKFDVDLHDDIRDLSPERMAELVDWRNFYINSAKYVHVGRVIGRFYDDKGNPLPLLALWNHTQQTTRGRWRRIRPRAVRLERDVGFDGIKTLDHRCIVMKRTRRFRGKSGQLMGERHACVSH